MTETTVQTKYKKLNWEQFEEQYKPQQNHILGEDVPMSGWMYETYGDEMEFIRHQPGNNVWTVLDVDGGTIFSNGFHLVNRMGYIITEVPYEDDDDIEVIDDDDQRMYFSHLRILEDATGKYIEVGYNDVGFNSLMWSWAEDHLQMEEPDEFMDEKSEYEFEEHLKELGFSLEASEQAFPDFETLNQ